MAGDRTAGAVRRRWLVRVLAAALLLLVFAGGIVWLRDRDLLLASEPERRAAQLDLPAQESAVALQLRLPFDLLRQAADRAVPAEFRQASAADAGTRYDLVIRREGRFTLSEAGGRLRVQVPLSVSGSVGLGGGLAEFLSLDEKKIDAAAMVQADLGLTLDRGWCPAVDMAVDYRWTRSPRLEILGGVWIGIEERVRAQIEAALHGLPEQLARLVPCGTIRRQALELWQPRDIRVQLPAAPPLWIGIQPQSVGLSELVVEPGRLRVVLGLRARTSIASRKPDCLLYTSPSPRD